MGDLSSLADAGLVGLFCVLLLVGKWVRLAREVEDRDTRIAELKIEVKEWKTMVFQYQNQWADEVLPTLRSTHSTLEKFAEKVPIARPRKERNNGE